MNHTANGEFVNTEDRKRKIATAFNLFHNHHIIVIVTEVAIGFDFIIFISLQQI